MRALMGSEIIASPTQALNPRTLNPEIIVQVVVGWVTEEGAVLERCVTRRMRVTQSKEAYMDSIDLDAAALLLAKKVLRGC